MGHKVLENMLLFNCMSSKEAPMRFVIQGKRGRVSMAQMQVRTDDVPMVQACFAIKEFKAKAWLSSLAPQIRDEYACYLKANRGTDRIVEKTVSTINEMKALEDR